MLGLPPKDAVLPNVGAPPKLGELPNDAAPPKPADAPKLVGFWNVELAPKPL